MKIGSGSMPRSVSRLNKTAVDSFFNKNARA
jgi:hypothetical protein